MSALHQLTTSTFRSRLASAVAEVESGSATELVVLVAPRSGNYPEIGWQLGVCALVLTLTTLVFLPSAIGDYTLYLAPLVACALGFSIPMVFPGVRCWLASRAAKARNVELVARATFQKAGLSATRDASALLVYVSLLERAVLLVPDRGVSAAVPAAWLDGVRDRCVASLRDRDPGAALLAVVRGLAPELALHLPIRPDDMNELPDAIDVVF